MIWATNVRPSADGLISPVVRVPNVDRVSLGKCVDDRMNRTMAWTQRHEQILNDATSLAHPGDLPRPGASHSLRRRRTRLLRRRRERPLGSRFPSLRRFQVTLSGSLRAMVRPDQPAIPADVERRSNRRSPSRCSLVAESIR